MIIKNKIQRGKKIQNLRVATSPKPKPRSRISADLIAPSFWLCLCADPSVECASVPESAKSINKNQLQTKK